MVLNVLECLKPNMYMFTVHVYTKIHYMGCHATPQTTAYRVYGHLLSSGTELLLAIVAEMEVDWQ